ncbi:MAG: alpha/beta hydrolase [Chlorobi bacterium]|nr:alpha/beta hydrolase [Chlorobiota bacterium]
MTQYIILFNLLFTVLFVSFGQASPQTVTFKSTDGLTVTADLYMIADREAPFIILFHQAGYSRGEYREIAPKLNALGFNCMAVDQRSGGEVNGIVNETHKRAEEAGMKTKYADAFPDLEAALSYVKVNFKPKNLIIWGSSYSSALVFVLAAKYPDDVDGILSFSPGNYFKMDGKTIADYAGEVTCPVFITSAKSERESWQSIFDSLKSTDKNRFLPEEKGYHGSKALWAENKGHNEYWKAVKEFLKRWE